MDVQNLRANIEYDSEEKERLVAQMLRRDLEATVLTKTQHTAKNRALLVKALMPAIEIWELPAKPIGHASRFPSGQDLRGHATKHCGT